MEGRTPPAIGDAIRERFGQAGLPPEEEPSSTGGWNPGSVSDNHDFISKAPGRRFARAILPVYHAARVPPPSRWNCPFVAIYLI